MTEFYAIIAGVLTSIRLIPQLAKSFKTQSTKDLSLYFLVILFFQSAFLILYGISKPDSAIIYMNIIPLICASMLLYLKRKFR